MASSMSGTTDDAAGIVHVAAVNAPVGFLWALVVVGAKVAGRG